MIQQHYGNLYEMTSQYILLNSLRIRLLSLRVTGFTVQLNLYTNDSCKEFVPVLEVIFHMVHIARYSPT